MNRLARFAERGQLACSLLVVLGLGFPLVLPVALGAAAFATLRRGLNHGLVVAASGVLFVASVELLAKAAGASNGTDAVHGLAISGGLLLGTVAMAGHLRRRNNLATAVLMGLAFGIGILIAVFVGLDDPAASWRAGIEQAMTQVKTEKPAPELDQWVENLPYAALTGIAVAMGLLLCWGGLFIGRSWQAAIVNPGGFGRAFRELRLGRITAYASAAILFAEVAIKADWLLNVSVLLIYLWVIQGLALIHWARLELGWSRSWLIGVYVLLIVFMPTNPLALLVPLLGAAGEFYDVRSALLRWRDSRRD